MDIHEINRRVAFDCHEQGIEITPDEVSIIRRSAIDKIKRYIQEESDEKVLALVREVLDRDLIDTAPLPRLFPVTEEEVAEMEKWTEAHPEAQPSPEVAERMRQRMEEIIRTHFPD